MSSDNTECQICMEVYTSDSSHRITALKCGHIFGRSCIEQWMKVTKRKTQCPMCYAPVRKTHLRSIFVTAVSSTDYSEEKRLSEMYRKEHSLRLELEDKLWRMQVQHSSSQLASANTSKKQVNSNPHSPHLKLSVALNAPGGDTRLLLVHSYEGENYVFYELCVAGNQYFKVDCIENPNKVWAVKIRGRIRVVHLRPETIAPCLVLVDSSLIFLYPYISATKEVYPIATDNPEFDIGPTFPITACFDRKSPTKTYSVFRGGFLRVFDTSNAVEDIYISEVINPHTILQREDGKVVIAGPFCISVFNPVTEDICSRDVDSGYICTGVASSGRNMLISYRTHGDHMVFEIMGDIQRHFIPKVRQPRRRPNRIIKDHYLYIINESNNELMVCDCRNLDIMHTYKFESEILDFNVTGTSTVVITATKFHVYV